MRFRGGFGAYSAQRTISEVQIVLSNSAGHKWMAGGHLAWTVLL